VDLVDWASPTVGCCQHGRPLCKAICPFAGISSPASEMSAHRATAPSPSPLPWLSRKINRTDRDSHPISRVVTNTCRYMYRISREKQTPALIATPWYVLPNDCETDRVSRVDLVDWASPTVGCWQYRMLLCKAIYRLAGISSPASEMSAHRATAPSPSPLLWLDRRSSRSRR
jgi:hypothetical protein